MCRFLFLIIALSISSLSLFSMETPQNCLLCDKPSSKKCGGCSKIYFCSAECQKKSWPTHKRYCKQNELFSKEKAQHQEYYDYALTRDEIDLSAFALFGEAAFCAFAYYPQGISNSVRDIRPFDCCYDQLATFEPIHSAVCAQTFKKIAELIPTTNNPKLLFPGIGYLSAEEASAIQSAFQKTEIFGFDIDNEVIQWSKIANPNCAKNLIVGDGRKEETWANFLGEGVDIIVFNHPLFFERKREKQPATQINVEVVGIGYVMLEHVKKNFPNTPVVIINKSRREYEAMISALQAMNFEDIQVILNKDKAFNCFSFSCALLRSTNQLDCFLYLKSENKFDKKLFSDEAKIRLQTLKQQMKSSFQEYLIDAEYRYYSIILTKTPNKV